MATPVGPSIPLCVDLDGTLIASDALLDEAIQAGSESLVVGLFGWEQIPWGQLAFPSNGWALQHDREARASRDFTTRINPPGY